MKQLLFLALALLPCLAWAQYPSNGNQKITLGEQTSADGLIYRGVLADTGIINPASDTSAYIILDTVNHRFYNYNRATNVWSVAGGGTAVTSITGGTGLTGGTITSTGTLAADTSFLFTQSDTLGLNLTSRFAAKQNTLTLTTTGTSGAATLTGATLNIPQYTGGGVSDGDKGDIDVTNSGATWTIDTSAISLSGNKITGTLPVANGGTGQSTLTANKVLVGNGTTGILQPTNLHWDNTNSRLGVATSTPTQKLHVVGNAYITSKIGVGLDPSGIGGAVLGLQTTNNNTEYFRGYNATGSTRFGWDLVSDEAVLTLFGINDVKMRTNGDSYLNGGNVGIGTTGPTEKLHVVGNGLFTGSITANSLSLTTPLSVANGGTGITTFGAQHRIPYAASTTALTTSSALTFDASLGRLTVNGINTSGSSNSFVVNNSTPLSLFTIGNTGSITVRGTGNIGYNSFSSGQNRYQLYSDGNTNNPLMFYIAGGAKGSAYGEFSMNGDFDANAYIGGGFYFDTRDGVAPPVSIVVKDNNANPVRSANFMEDGEVFIGYQYGDDKGNYRLQVKDSLYIGGNVSASAYTTRSDYNLKDDIFNIKYGLNDILKLQPVEYTYKSNGSKQLGFIAQDIGTILPEVVSFEESMSVNYQAIIPILTKAIQEQQALIKALEQRIINLENK